MSKPSGDNEQDQTRRGYRYRPADAPKDQAAKPDDEFDEDELVDDESGEDDDDLADEDEGDEDEGDDQESEFWPAAEVLKGATVEDAELELSYAASVYVNTPAATLRLWLRMPDGRRRLVQVDEPHTVWFYRQDPRDAENFEEYPDHRFELPSSDLRVMRARRRRQLIDQQLALHEQLVAVGEELEQLEQDVQDDDNATADWPGARWPE
jgi:hypothetical protein